MAVGLKMISGDFIINNSGTLDIVTETDKAVRDFGKMLITKKEYQENITTFTRYNPTYGTELDNRSKYSGLSRAAIRDVVVTLLNEAITNYIALQEQRTNLSVGEIVTSVNFDAFYDIEDKRNLVVPITFSSAGGTKPISMGQYVQPIG